MLRKLLEIFRPIKRRRKLLTAQVLRYREYYSKQNDLLEWNALATKWGLGFDEDVHHAIQSIGQRLQNAEHLLHKKKIKKSTRCLNEIAKELDSKALHSAVNQQLARYRSRLSGLLLAAKDVANEVCQASHKQSIKTLLASCMKLCRQSSRDQALKEVVRTSNQSIELLERLINEIQSSSTHRTIPQRSIAEALARIRQQLRDHPQRDPFCKQVLLKELAMIFSLNKKRAHEDFKLAILCDAPALQQHFSALMGEPLKIEQNPMLSNDLPNTDSAVLWRLNITKGLLFYIVGVTPEHFQVKREWYSIIHDFSAVIVFLEDFSAPSDKEAEGILSALMLFQQDKILLAGPSQLDPEQTHKQFFLLDFLHNIKLLPNPPASAQ